MSNGFKPPIVIAHILVGYSLMMGRAGLTHYFICPISIAAPLAVLDNFNNASRPPAA
jgi:hypothetical protein